MTNEFVLEAIQREFPESIVQYSDSYGMLTIEIKKRRNKKGNPLSKNNFFGFSLSYRYNRDSLPGQYREGIGSNLPFA